MVRAADIGVAECWRDGLIATSRHDGPPRGCARPTRPRSSRCGTATPSWRFLYRLAHWLRPNTRAGSRQQHPRPLRPGQRLLRAVARPDDDLLLGASSRRGSTAPWSAAQEAKYERMLEALGVEPRRTTCSRSAAAGAASRSTPCARAAAAGRASPSRRRSSSSPASASARRGSRTASSCASRTTATSRAQFDRIVSVEMIEAVGERWWPAYFGKVHDCLKPGGRASIQAITIDEAAFEKYRRTSDFIREYIFPGGMLAPVERPREGSARSAGLRGARAVPLRRCTTRRRCAAGASAWTRSERAIKALGFDDTLPRPLALLPALLRGGLRREAHRRRAPRAREAGMRRGAPRGGRLRAPRSRRPSPPLPVALASELPHAQAPGRGAAALVRPARLRLLPVGARRRVVVRPRLRPRHPLRDEHPGPRPHAAQPRGDEAARASPTRPSCGAGRRRWTASSRTSAPATGWWA